MKLLVGKYDISIVLCYLRNIVILFLLYMFIFNPPFRFVPFGITKFYYLFGVIYLIYQSKLNSYIITYKSIIRPLLIYIFYALIIHLVTFSKASFAQINLFVFFESFIVTYVIAEILVRIYKTKADKMVMWVIIVASFISVFLILNPEFNSYVRDILLLEQRQNIEHVLAFRSFGIADDLLYTYAIVLGIGICLCFKYAKKGKFYYLFLLPLLIGVFFNARIGVVPIILYLFYLVIIERKLSLIIYIAVSIFIAIFLLLNSSFGEDYEMTINWIIDGFNEISNVFTGEQSEKNTNTATLQRMIIFPESIGGFIFGTGKDLFLDSKNNSDIGYVLQIYYGGLVYLLLFLLVVFKLYIKLLANNLCNRWFNIVFIGTILLCNIKGYFFYTCSGMRVLMLLFFIYILLHKYRMDVN